MRHVLALLLVSQVAFADAPKYKEVLAKGRALAGQKKYPEAIAAFEKALVAFPDDSTLLAELGFTAFLAKDLVKAEAMTRRSLAGQPAPSIRGASLYNLGLIQEARGEKAAAIASYTESLKARPHSVVRTALAKLDPAAAAATDPYAPAKMAGPFASIDAYCKSRPTKDQYGEHECTCGTQVGDVASKLPAPFEKLMQISRECDMSGHGDVEWLVGAKLAAGWYFASVWDAPSTLKCDQKVSFKAPASQDDLLVVTYGVAGGCLSQDSSLTWQESGLVAIGVGPSRAPSASSVIPLTHKEDQEEVIHIDVALAIKWGKNHAFELTGKTKGVEQGAAANLLGAHTLVFP